MAITTYGYGFTPDQQKKIIEALTPKLRACGGCGGHGGTWQLVTEGVINMPIVPNFGAMSPFYSQPTGYGQQFYGQQFFPPRTLPCIAVTCSNCGHLQFYSVLQLGLGVVLGVVAPLISPEGE